MATCPNIFNNYGDFSVRTYNQYTAEAIRNLCPEANVTVQLEQIIWSNNPPNKPTEQQILAEEQRLIAVWESLEYQRKRIKEYPSPLTYLDAVVKGDQEQIQAYIDACLAVKAKYPKPEGV